VSVTVTVTVTVTQGGGGRGWLAGDTDGLAGWPAGRLASDG